MNKVTPFLMFNDQLEAAIKFYTATFPNSNRRKHPQQNRILARAKGEESMIEQFDQQFLDRLGFAVENLTGHHTAQDVHVPEIEFFITIT